MDGSSGKISSGTSMVLFSPNGYKHNCAVRFGLKATKNAVEYKALLGDLILAKEMQVKRLLINSDSQLIISWVNNNAMQGKKAWPYTSS